IANPWPQLWIVGIPGQIDAAVNLSAALRCNLTYGVSNRALLPGPLRCGWYHLKGLRQSGSMQTKGWRDVRAGLWLIAVAVAVTGCAPLTPTHRSATAAAARTGVSAGVQPLPTQQLPTRGAPLGASAEKSS